MSVLIENVEDFELTLKDCGSTDFIMFGDFPDYPGYLFTINEKDKLIQAVMNDFNNTPLDKFNSQLGMDILKKYMKPKYHCQLVDSILVPVGRADHSSLYRIDVYRRYANKIDIDWCFKLFIKEEYKRIVFDIVADVVTEEYAEVGWKVNKSIDRHGISGITYKPM